MAGNACAVCYRAHRPATCPKCGGDVHPVDFGSVDHVMTYLFACKVCNEAWLVEEATVKKMETILLPSV